MERTRQRQRPSELVAFCFSGALSQGERKVRGCMGGAQVSPGCLAAHVQGGAKPPFSSCPPYPAFSGRIPVFLFLWGKGERGVEPKTAKRARVSPLAVLSGLIKAGPGGKAGARVPRGYGERGQALEIRSLNHSDMSWWKLRKTAFKAPEFAPVFGASAIAQAALAGGSQLRKENAHSFLWERAQLAGAGDGRFQRWCSLSHFSR